MRFGKELDGLKFNVLMTRERYVHMDVYRKVLFNK